MFGLESIGELIAVSVTGVARGVTGRVPEDRWGFALLHVDFSSLEALAGSIRRATEGVEQALNDLEGQVRALGEVWSGAASEGFQRTQADWMASARDLRAQLNYLHELVTTAHGNHARAVATNSAIWRG